MSCVLAFIEDAEQAARILEDHEFQRLEGMVEKPRVEARKEVCRLVGCSPGTLENLRRGRLKRIEKWLHDALSRALVRKIEHEIKRLNAELEAAERSLGLFAEPDVEALAREIKAVVARADKLREALRHGGNHLQSG